jgi:uncharacterized protein (TIGR03437 family)
MIYAISDSGVMVLPVGFLRKAPLVTASAEDLLFKSSSCDHRVMSQSVTISDLGGGHVPFALSTQTPGIEISPASGTTPATVTVKVDPTAFQQQKGTVTGSIAVVALGAINVTDPIRVLINTRDPDQRGTTIDIPGKLVDLLADPARSRFYVLRQDKNLVLIYNADTYELTGTLRTSNTPTQMTMTADNKYLLVGHNDSQLAYVYDLDTLQQAPPIRFPMGHYPRSIAVAGGTILAASRVAGPPHTIDRVDFANRTATALPSLGVYKNDIHISTVLQATPNGSWIFAAMPDGNVMLYDASADSFTVSRKDFTTLGGAYAASNNGLFFVDHYLLNGGLVPVQRLDTSAGTSSGFTFLDQYGLRTSAASTGAGTIQRMNLASGDSILPVRTAEAPLTSATDVPFIRALAPLSNRQAIISLTTSGFTVLSWNYDAAVAPPRIDRVVNAADLGRPVAPGGLISVMGSDLSPVNIATKEIPLPTALGDSCLAVNGTAIPMIFVSPSRINAQLPFYVDGRVTVTLRTPGGVSDNINLTVLPTAPSVFVSDAGGPGNETPMVYRAKNGELVTGSNPIHPDDSISIILTGLGRTSPAVEEGMPSPSDPMALAIVQPTVTLGGTTLPVLFAGLVPGQTGVYQIDARVPFHGIPLGFDIPLVIMQGGASTTISVRVVD